MKFNIKDANGNVTNTIKANLEFVEATFEHYEEYVAPTPVEPTAEEPERTWRDEELARTDIAATVSDYPNAKAYIVYRQSLRSWPSTSDFPNIRPELGE
jgi:hypothetical protein